ncbi:phosphoribosylanthranilate isomerase [Cyanobium gracile]|uniref:N-(5'-phosphoribosyl)anthranilate isomerase n=1 Tax=Cyanobium gracile (strain ATCC 27147 / PCC 6307) TaxID=292564 RepID=K9P2P3_CYAGP|nr:phosphoribosylanthranilate isomerase [Cyanobium gracile]AFY27253.1 phosphoribosylanthranilate isomerase [Cyanobium gracile PCC 6307]
MIPVTTPLLKICGLREPAQATAIAALGADAIGVIAVPGSPRYVPPEQRAALFAAMAAGRPAIAADRPDCFGVLVVADPGDDQLEELAAGQGHAVVQLHGEESAERCRELGGRLGVRLWKALRVRTPEDLERAAAYAGVVEALLLDAWCPGQLGGTGHRIPIEWLEHFRPSMPWWLAGGVGPGTAGELLARLRPDGLDASSALEERPGVKDLARVASLVAAVRGSGGG